MFDDLFFEGNQSHRSHPSGHLPEFAKLVLSSSQPSRRVLTASGAKLGKKQHSYV